MPPRPSSPSSPIRGALIAGFGVVFALWLASGYQLVASIRDAEGRRATLHQSFLHGEQILNTITTRVLLGSIKMEMGVALRGVEADARARTALEAARAIAESTLQSVRDLSQVLHPSMLDDFGLPEALRAHLRSFSNRSDIRAQLIYERMTDRLPADIEVCVYRIVQEALTNVARHSGAASCTVSLVRRENTLHLTVEDDGNGLASMGVRTPDARRGLGLIGMRERAQHLAGTFLIENRFEGGTRVVVKLPVPPVVEAERQEQLAG